MACIAELEGVKEPRLKEYVEFAVEAAESLRDGRWRASQALSANLMDSILNRSFDKASKKRLTDQKTRVGWEDYPIRSALVIGGIWGSYSEYWPSKGDPIPRRYTRHASAHGVSRRQYTRLNAVIALMHIVGLLKVSHQALRSGYNCIVFSQTALRLRQNETGSCRTACSSPSGRANRPWT